MSPNKLLELEISKKEYIPSTPLSGPKTRSRRGQNTANILSDLMVFSVFYYIYIYIYICFVFGILTIPKGLIKVPGHIPIPFGSFLELPECSLNLAPYTPYLSQKHFKRYK